MKYKDLYPFSLSDGNGLISTLSNVIDIPWNALTTDQKISLERLYNMRSGFKEVTPSFTEISMPDRPVAVAQMYAQKWKRLFDAYMEEFNILDAYYLTETGNRKKDTTNDRKKDTTGERATTFGKEVTENGTDTGTTQNDGTDTTKTTGGLYGFNSTEAVQADVGVEEITSNNLETRDNSTTRTTANSGTDTENVTGNETENATGNETEEYSYTKKGNIGYTTPQEMIRQTLELWKEPFFSIVFSDIDKLIILQVY